MWSKRSKLREAILQYIMERAKAGVNVDEEYINDLCKYIVRVLAEKEREKG